MKNLFRIFFIPVLLLLLAGCAGVTTQPENSTAPGEVPQQSGEGAIVEPPLPLMSGNHAVIALLDLAQRDNEAGRREAAGASLERALRIEPRNPWLWHQLAQLRLTQGQYGQAISLARKSTSFARDDRRLQALNWRLIGNARIAKGDTAGAELAFKQATGLEQSGRGY